MHDLATPTPLAITGAKPAEYSLGASIIIIIIVAVLISLLIYFKYQQLKPYFRKFKL